MPNPTRRFLGLFAAAAILAASGCQKGNAPAGNTATNASDIKLGYIVKQPEEKWFQNEWMFAQKAADDNHFQLIKIGAEDGEKVLSAIDNLAANGA